MSPFDSDHTPIRIAFRRLEHPVLSRRFNLKRANWQLLQAVRRGAAFPWMTLVKVATVSSMTSTPDFLQLVQIPFLSSHWAGSILDFGGAQNLLSRVTDEKRSIGNTGE